MNENIEEIWKEFSARFPEAERIDLTAEIEGADRECQQDSSASLGQWLPLVDESLRFLITLLRLAEEGLDHVEDRRPAAGFLMLVGRSVSLLRAVHLLATHGLEDAARPVARSLLETLDLALVALSDPDFAEAFLTEDDEENFWKAKVGFGRLQKRIEEVLQRLNVLPEEISFLKADRAYIGRALSGSVHSSVSSACRSYFVPSLRHPGKLAKRSLGHISIHAPGLLLGMAEHVHKFGVIALKLITSERPPALFSNAGELKVLTLRIPGHVNNRSGVM